MVYFPVTRLSPEDKAPFGELLTSEPTPAFHLRFDYPVVNPYKVIAAATGSGAVFQSDNQLTVQTTSGRTWARSVERVSYCPGEGLDLRFTARWSATSITGIAVAGLAETDSGSTIVDGYVLGYTSTSFAVFTYRGGSATSVLSVNFNVDRLDGTGPSGMTINTANLNVFRITVQFLGAGVVTYQIMNPATGAWTTMHVVRYPNTSTLPHSYNPSLRFLSYVSATSTYNLSHSSVGCFINGKSGDTLGILNSVSNTKSVTAQVSVLSLTNRATFNGLTNRAISILKVLSMASSGNQPVVVRLFLNATVTGASYVNIDTTSSITSSDTTGTTVSGGRVIMSFSLGKADNLVVDLSPYRIVLYPETTLTLAATSTLTNDVFFSITFEEIL